MLPELLNAAGGHALGYNAMACFQYVLLFVLVVVGLFISNQPSSSTRLSALLAGPVAIVLLCVGVFLIVAFSLKHDPHLLAFDQALSDTVQNNLEPAQLRNFAWITHLGDSATFTVLCIVVAAILLWQRQWPLALAYVVAVGGNSLINPGLKAVFERLRPAFDHSLTYAHGWSFPSGHASGSVVVYGMLAYVLMLQLQRRWHLPLAMAAAALVFTTGCSRVFLQVHYLTDVLAGFASGVAWLTCCITGVELWRYREARRSLPLS